jgi:hypothetical protein
MTRRALQLGVIRVNLRPRGSFTRFTSRLIKAQAGRVPALDNAPLNSFKIGLVNHPRFRQPLDKR